MTTYTIHHNNGNNSNFGLPTEAACIADLKREYGHDIVVSGEWDTYGSDGAERQLVWADMATAEADETGAHAVAEIVRRE